MHRLAVSNTHSARILAAALMQLLSALSVAAAPLDAQTQKAIQDSLSTNFVTAALLSNDQVIKLGVWDFDPNQYLDSDNPALGSSDATALRQTMTQLSVPFYWQLTDPDASDQLWAGLQFSYLEVDRKGRIVESEALAEDRINQQVLSLGGGIDYLHAVDEHWQIELGVTTKWMRYRNSADYKTPESQAIASSVDGTIFNYHTELLMGESVAGANYSWLAGAAKYKASSSFHYMRGMSLNPGIQAHDVKPEAWYLSTGIATLLPVAAAQNVHLELTRIDIGGDLEQGLGTDHYYQASAIWVLDVNIGDEDSLVDNIGLGLNLTYGSSLKGGTIIFVYNFDAL